MQQPHLKFKASTEMVSGKPEVRFAKTKMCKFHLQGKCAKGASCSFAHGCDEMEDSPDLYRTQLCMALYKTGTCKDSENCKYAHTREQLRALPGSSDTPFKMAYGSPKSKPKPNKSCNDTPSPKPRPGSRTITPGSSLPGSPQPQAMTPGVVWAAVPLAIPVVGMGSPTNAALTGGFMLPYGAYAVPYAPCDEPALPPPSPHMAARKQPGLVRKQAEEEEEETTGSSGTEDKEISDSENPKPFNYALAEPEAMSETSTIESEGRDKSSADEECYESMGSSIYSNFTRSPSKEVLPDFEPGFEVSIKNTFLTVAPTTPSKRLQSQSVPRKLSFSGAATP